MISKQRIIKKLRSERFLIAIGIGLAATCFYLRRIPLYTRDDFRVVYTLLVFLVIVKGLEGKGALCKIASRFREGRYLYLKLTLLTALLSMLVTNDVALLTVVPLTLALDLSAGREAFLLVLETITANGASTLTPFGNPQNMFIYYYYHLNPWEFAKAIAPLSIVSLALVLLVAYIMGKNYRCEGGNGRGVSFDRAAYVYLLCFSLFILAVLRVLPLAVGVLPLIYAFLFDRASLSVDYLLLLTFVVFFGFTDNLIHILHISLESSTQVFLCSTLASQVISNVPSALLLADFTNNWKALLWGVSVGGFGNLIGSLASLISYRLYKAKSVNAKGYLIRFHIYGYASLFAGLLVYFLVNKA